MKNIIINNLFFAIIINIIFNNKLYNIKILNINKNWHKSFKNNN